MFTKQDYLGRMSVDLVVRKTKIGGVPALVPTSKADLATLDRLKDGRYGARLARPRSRKHENWFRKLCRAIGEAIDWHEGKVYTYFKLEHGDIRASYDIPGWGTTFELVSATQMDEDAYKSLTDFALDHAFKELLAGSDRKVALKQIYDLAGPRPT